MQFVHFSGAGGNEVVSLRSATEPGPGDEQVLVASRFVGINPLDVLQRDGNYPVPEGASPHLPGVEVAGSVVAVGAAVDRWRVGDRVMGLVAQGGLADRVLAHQAHLMPIPESVSDAAAAAFPEVVITAYDALLRAGAGVDDLVVIRGVNGGVGVASYRIAEALGARPLGVVRSAGLVDALAARGIRAVLPEDLQTGAATSVLELVGGRFVADDLELLAPQGRIVLVSLAAGTEARISLATLLSRRLEVIGTTLRPRGTVEKAQLVAEVARRVLPMAAQGRVEIPVEATYPAARITDAFDRLGTPGKIGKVLVDFGA